MLACVCLLAVSDHADQLRQARSHLASGSAAGWLSAVALDLTCSSIDGLDAPFGSMLINTPISASLWSTCTQFIPSWFLVSHQRNKCAKTPCSRACSGGMLCIACARSAPISACKVPHQLL